MVVRILHVVTKMDAGGIETLLMNLYRNINRSKIQFDFLTHRKEEGYYDKEIIGMGGRIFRVPAINPLHHNNYRSKLDSFFSEHPEYKIVHSHINTYSMYPLRAAKKANVPVRIAHSHVANVPFDLKTPFRLYTKLLLKRYSTHNFACSTIAGKWLYGNRAVFKPNFKVINNSIDVDKFTYNPKNEIIYKKRLGLEGRFVIGHIGRFVKLKNHDFLINIFLDILQIEPSAMLILIGDGELRENIEGRVDSLGIKDKVLFTGVQSNVNELIQAVDVFVFPSQYEGLGIVAVEAQAAGLPCLVSESVPPEVNITDSIEFISLKKSSQYWANKILKFKGYKKKNTSKIIKKAGFDIKEQAIELEELYYEFLK